MSNEAPTERFADTGYSVKDTSPEVNRIMFERIMALTPGERLEMGLRMLGTAKELIRAGLAEDLPESEKRRLVYERLYGEPLPPGCPV